MIRKGVEGEANKEAKEGRFQRLLFDQRHKCVTEDTFVFSFIPLSYLGCCSAIAVATIILYFMLLYYIIVSQYHHIICYHMILYYTNIIILYVII